MTRSLAKGSSPRLLMGMQPCSVKLGGRPRRAERGELVVPERRQPASARQIRVPVVRVLADRPEGRPPVFRLGGGPGMSNMRFACPPALAAHDVILVGYRGVDGPVRLHAPEVAAALRAGGGDLLGEPSRHRVAQAAAAAAHRLHGSGVDVAGYTVAESLADLDDARAVLGYDRIGLLSESYGTRLALLYAQTHPERVHRSVLLGVNPPGRFIWDPMVTDAQLADWGRLWAGSGPGRDRDLAAVIRTGRERLPGRWLGLRLDPGKARILTFAMLFQRRTALVAIDAWQAAARGDPSGVALLCLAYDLMVPRLFTWGDFLAKAYSTDYQPDTDYPARLGPPAAALGSPLSLLFFGGGPGWPPTSAPQPLQQLHRCPVESLLISGELDVSIPPQYARKEALPYLPRGSQVIIPNAAHVEDMWGLQPQATTRLIAGFLATGNVAAHYDAAIPALKPALRLPTAARLAAGGLLTGAAASALTAAAWWKHCRH
jgi:pimeloyl-ACP methyl ester carboxylesterase